MHLKQANYPAEHHNQLHQRAFRKPPFGSVVASPFAALPRYLQEVRSQWLSPTWERHPSGRTLQMKPYPVTQLILIYLFRLNGSLLTCQSYPVNGH